ncbi:MAG: hypothetical protein NTX63_04555 [Candidatus Peregrinibacteria bacterium]|nr:hypothetical protein [Candidatus Peregrinibacteria bacterium]
MPGISHSPNSDRPSFDPEGLQQSPHLTAEQLHVQDRLEAVDYYKSMMRRIHEMKQKFAEGKEIDGKSILREMYAHFPDYHPNDDEPLSTSIEKLEVLFFRLALQKFDCEIPSYSFHLCAVQMQNTLKILERITKMLDLRISPSSIRGFLNEVQSLLNAEPTFDMVLSYLPDAIRLGLSPDEALQFWVNREGDEDPLSAIRHMKSDGISDQYLDTYNAHYKSKKSSFKRIYALLPLKEFMFDEVATISDFDAPVEDLSDYFLYVYSATHASPLSLIALYKLERDPAKAVEISENGHLFSDKRFENTIFPIILAHGLSAIPEATQKNTMYFINQIAPVIKSDSHVDSYDATKIAILLWRLAEGDLGNARIIYHVTFQSDRKLESENIFTGNIEDAYPFVVALQGRNIPFAKIIDLWSYSHGPYEALQVDAFVSWIEPQRKHFKIASPKEPKGQDQYDAMKAFSSLPPEAKDFVPYLLDNHYYVPYRNLALYFQDPSMLLCVQIYKTLGTKNVADALRLGRSLYYQNVKFVPSKDLLLLKLKEFEAHQLSSDQIVLFEGRNLVFLANSETSGPFSKSRFNGLELQENLKKSVGEKGTSSLHAPKSENPDTVELNSIKKSVLEEITSTPPPMTFFFNGHGQKDSIYMNNGKIPGTDYAKAKLRSYFDTFTDYISVDDFAKAVAKRKQKFPDNSQALSRDIYIFDGCYQHEFIRKFYELIAQQDGIAPITIAPAEFGQYSFSDPRSFVPLIGKLFDEDPNDIIFRLGTLGTKIGDIRKNVDKYSLSRYVVYVPNAAGQPQQVVMNGIGGDDS